MASLQECLDNCKSRIEAGGVPFLLQNLEGQAVLPQGANMHIEADAFASMAQKLHSKGEVMSPPKQAAKLPSLVGHCECGLEWHCKPHGACFIHDSCFCKGSSSFPPIKPPHSSWSQFSYDWYIKLASGLKLHPHAPLPHIVSKVEHPPFVMHHYCPQPPI